MGVAVLCDPSLNSEANISVTLKLEWATSPRLP